MTLMASNQQVVNTPQSDDVVLSVQGVSKKFCRDLKRSLLYGVRDIGKEFLGLRGEKNDKLRKKEFWALQDVSFELRRGEALGLVGKNGSGKSTLLRIIAGLIKPDVGMVQVNGRVAPLIALGAGFNPVLTGRENIYANMSILGLSKEEIDERFDEVVAFAEIGEAIDSPVQTYSSGMAARLGFTCAIHTDPDILLIDEVLAVGDIKFRKKCFRRLGYLREKGISFVLVSHNTQAFFTVCTSALHLSQGRLLARGTVDQVIQSYEQELFLPDDKFTQGALQYKKEVEDNVETDFSILGFRFDTDFGGEENALFTGRDAVLEIKCQSSQKVKRMTVYLLISEMAGGEEITLSIDSAARGKYFDLPMGDSIISLKFQNLGLKPGRYCMKLIFKEDSISVLDFVEEFYFDVKSEICLNRSAFHQEVEWSCNKSLS